MYSLYSMWLLNLNAMSAHSNDGNKTTAAKPKTKGSIYSGSGCAINVFINVKLTLLCKMKLHEIKLWAHCPRERSADSESVGDNLTSLTTQHVVKLVARVRKACEGAHDGRRKR